VLLSYLAVTSPGADLCAQSSARCEAPAPPANDAEAGGDLASPAVVDCRWLGSSAASAADPLVLVGACEPPAKSSIADAWYRISRTPDSERSAGAVSAARARRGGRLQLAYDRSPERTPPVAPGTGQQLAVVLVPGLSPPPDDLVAVHRDRILLPARTLDPPDRPPRA